MKLKDKLLGMGTNPTIAKVTKPIVKGIIDLAPVELADIEAVHTRLQTCRKNECGNYQKKGNNEVCGVEQGGCGCFLSEKTRLKHETCPKKLW